ncbi:MULTISPECIES: carbohydrate ABC transporter permease [unclassified Streptomyces]|uniref:carbohydrate ABC transporter permease n=1 Tax=unclassified Streptomyces TaxID=2593676 RepID=UPI00278C0337|nr:MULTISPECIES: sugar ABC transporter permease [unclassified Streptomyces]
MTSTPVKSAAKPPYRAPRPLGGRVRARPSPRGRQGAHAAAFLAPGLTVLAVFVFWPILQAFRLSFTDATGFTSGHWVGLDNYLRIFQDPDVGRAFLNTGLYAVLFTPAVVCVALLGALLLNQRLPLRTVSRTLFFLPFVMSFAVAALAWQYLLDPNVGLVNYWLRQVGLDLGNPLQSPTWAMPVVVFVAVWKMAGFYMVVFLAGLQDIPRHLYEAAAVDGAGPLRRFTTVTLPGLTDKLAFVLIFAVIAAFQAFDQIYIMTSGGPYRSTETLVMSIFTEGFANLKLGFASALAIVLMLVTFALSAVQYRWFGRREGEAA